MRLALTLSLAAALLAACPADADAQACAPPSVCTTGEAVNAAADTLCRRARAAELRLAGVTDDLAAVQAQRDVCHGRLLQLVETRAVPPPTRAPLWLRITLDVAVGVLGATAGTLIAVDAPREVAVGFAVASAGALVSRVVLEIVW